MTTSDLCFLIKGKYKEEQKYIRPNEINKKEIWEDKLKILHRITAVNMHYVLINGSYVQKFLVDKAANKFY